jgi:UDP-glucose 4-epimerase
LRILITGADGFVGSALTRVLGSGEHELVGVTLCPPGSDGSKVDWIAQDLSQPIDCSRFPEHLDAVIHLAQSLHYRAFPARACDIFSVNVASTMQLLDYARGAGARVFLYTSSGGVYGRPEGPAREEQPPDLVSFYNASKHMSEIMMRFYSPYFATVVLRPFFVYGEGQKGMLIPSLVERIDEGQPVLLRGEHGMRINPIHVDDVVQVICRCLSLTTPEILNVAGTEVVNLEDLALLMGEFLGKSPLFERVDDQGLEALVADIGKLKKVLSFAPGIGVREGIQRIVHDYLTRQRGVARI